MSSNRKTKNQLLPKSSGHFARKDYWNKFFKTRNDPFEWYAEYHHLNHLFQRYIKQNDSLLVIGCGNSSLSADLYDMGFKNNTSVDISEVVVQQMHQKYNSNGQRNGLEFKCMDVFDLKFDPNSLSVVIDKGTLDAIASDNQSINITKMFEQIDSVLKTFGRYLCISLLESHILKKLMDWFTKNGNWFIRIERIESAEDMTRQQSEDESLVLPVFAVICTKLLAQNPKQNTLIEVSFNGTNGKPKRLNDVNEVMEQIESLQEFAFIQQYIKNINITKEEDIHLDLFNEEDSVNPRYTLYFSNYINKRSKSVSSCGVYIVPEGREVEWIFGTTKGRIELTKQTAFERLIVVHLNRNHVFSNGQQIRSELSPKILELIPKSVLNSDSQIPYLTVGEDVGKRSVVFEGKSELSGDYVVEDIAIDADIYRRLIFLKNKNVIQSESRLKSIKKRKKKVLVIDPDYLSCSHHEIITSGLTFLPNDVSKQFHILLIGLGGGCLTTYMTNNIRNDVNLNIKVIEIDPSMKDIALKWFDLKTSNEWNNVKVDIEVEDGLKYIERLDPRTQSYDSIIFDVDSKELNVGLSCPPMPFIESQFLEKVKQLLSERNGIFVLNLVSRNEDIKKDVYNRLNRIFESTFVFPLKQELNEILFSFSTKTIPNWIDQKGSTDKMDNFAKHCFYVPLLKDSYIDLCGNRLRKLS